MGQCGLCCHCVLNSQSLLVPHPGGCMLKAGILCAPCDLFPLMSSLPPPYCHGRYRTSYGTFLRRYQVRRRGGLRRGDIVMTRPLCCAPYGSTYGQPRPFLPRPLPPFPAPSSLTPFLPHPLPPSLPLPHSRPLSLTLHLSLP